MMSGYFGYGYGAWIVCAILVVLFLCCLFYWGFYGGGYGFRFW